MSEKFLCDTATSETLLLDIERHHASIMARAARARDPERIELALSVADGLAAAMTGYSAVSLTGLGAKARVLARQAAGRLGDLVEGGSPVERVLIAAFIAEAAALLPTAKRVRSTPRLNARTPLARIGAEALDESAKEVQPCRLHDAIPCR